MPRSAATSAPSAPYSSAAAVQPARCRTRVLPPPAAPTSSAVPGVRPRIARATRCRRSRYHQCRSSSSVSLRTSVPSMRLLRQGRTWPSPTTIHLVDVTAPAPVLPIGQALVVEMGAEPVIVEEASRPLYHAALAHGANHLVTLVAESLDLLGAAGVEPAGRVLGPLLSAALDNALRQGDGALTGPVARGDAGTVAAHVDAIGASGVEGALATYRRLARDTADRALASGRLRPEAAQSLLEALADDAP